MPKLTIPIRGMHCKSCEILIENNLKKIVGVKSVTVSHSSGKAEVHYQDKSPQADTIKQAVKDAGYSIGQKEALPWLSKDKSDYKNLFWAAVTLWILYILAKWFGLLSLNVNTEKSGLAVVFLVGLVAGISTCMALVGGLVLALSARHNELHPEATSKQKFRPHIYFNIGRVIGFGILGGVIGALGSALRPSAGFMGIMTLIVGAVMIFLGLKLIEIFPALRDKNIALPKSISRLFGMKGDAKEYSHRGAMLTGALTFFLPCGFTQAMQLYAVSTGSFWQGAAIMSLFALGTAPGLLGIGGLSSIFKGHKARRFFAVAGLAVIILGWVNIANGSRLMSSFSKSPSNNTVQSANVQEVRMTQNFDGYSPNTFTVQKGKTVKWIINSTTTYSCASYIVMSKYNISQPLQKGENIITFTPTETGEIPFSCSMGMYRGKFIVVDSAGSSQSGGIKVAVAPSVPSAPSGGSCGAGGGGCGCGGGARKQYPATTGEVAVQGEAQIITTSFTYNEDIQPNTFSVQAGKAVRFVVDPKEDGSGCMSTIMIPGLYNTPQLLQKGRQIVMEFTPTSPGDFPITCAMGVPRGTLKVI